MSKPIKLVAVGEKGNSPVWVFIKDKGCLTRLGEAVLWGIRWALWSGICIVIGMLIGSGFR